MAKQLEAAMDPAVSRLNHSQSIEGPFLNFNFSGWPCFETCPGHISKPALVTSVIGHQKGSICYLNWYFAYGTHACSLELLFGHVARGLPSHFTYQSPVREDEEDIIGLRTSMLKAPALHAPLEPEPIQSCDGHPYPGCHQGQEYLSTPAEKA